MAVKGKQQKKARQNRTAHHTGAIWIPAFLSSLKLLGNITLACNFAMISRSVVYERRNSDPAFKLLWDDAIEEAADRLEAEARRRAEEGVLEPVYQKGVLVGYVQRYSDTLMALLLKAHKPEKYRERFDFKLTPAELQKLSDADLLKIVEGSAK